MGKKSNGLKIKYTPKRNLFVNPNNALPISGTIYRVYTRHDNKSLIDITEGDVNTVLKKMVNLLNERKYNNRELQKAWNNNRKDFEAEDLQHYFSNENPQILLNNWKKFYGGAQGKHLYNNDIYKDFAYVDGFDPNSIQRNKVNNEMNTDFIDNDVNKLGNESNNQFVVHAAEESLELIKKENKDLLEENEYYSRYVSELLRINSNYKDQINSLNHNLIQLTNYNLDHYHNLTEVNDELLKHLDNKPLQVLQLLSSMLNIVSAECFKQFDTIKSSIPDMKSINTDQIQINNDDKNNSQQKQLEKSKNMDIDNNDIENNTLDKAQNLDKQQNILAEKLDEIQNIADTSMTYDEIVHNEKMKLINNSVSDSSKTKRLLLAKSEDDFEFYQGKEDLATWLNTSLIWLKSHNATQFANELKYEVNNIMNHKKMSKAVRYSIEYIKGNDYRQIAKNNNDNVNNVMRSMDQLQATHPALYLAFGFKKERAGKPKRVMTNLLQRGVTDTPLTF